MNIYCLFGGHKESLLIRPLVVNRVNSVAEEQVVEATTWSTLCEDDALPCVNQIVVAPDTG